MAVEEATWERLQEFQDLYSDFQLEDELFVEAGEML
jgi:transcriptional regulator GlxA family with amidase domain